MRIHRLAQTLTLLSFALSCWTLHRALRPRVGCVSSPFLYAVVTEGQRVNNCVFESRLSLHQPSLSARARTRLRHLEDVAALNAWFAHEPRVVIEVDERDVHAFAVRPGYARVGAAWIDEGRQLGRLFAITLITSSRRGPPASPFTAEALADFVTLAAGASPGYAPADVSFLTASPTLATYCASPLRSLAHRAACRGPAPAHDRDANVWGFRPLLAVALARTFAELNVRDKLRVMAAVRDGVVAPSLSPPTSTTGAERARWFREVVRAHAGALQMLTGPAADRALDATLATLDVGAPVSWALTFDLRHTPKWREITGQLLARARFRPRERALVFTPEGQLALPSGLNAEWATTDVRTEKHVLIACALPAAKRAVNVRARQLFARQTCDALRDSFWD